MGKKAKKKEERALVKRAAQDLGVDYEKGMGVGDLIRSEADRLVRQSAASIGIDSEGDLNRWRGVMRSRRDLTPIAQDRLIDVANYLRRQNPLANRICDLKRDFVIGDGLSFEAEDQDIIQPILDQFWDDHVNNLDEFQFDMVDSLATNGELFLPVFVNEYSGAVQLGYIDPVEVEMVVPDKLNRRIMRTVAMKFGAGAGYSSFYDLSVKKQYAIANIDTNSQNRKTFNLRVGDILYFRINCAPDAMRGRSDLESWADLCDAWDQANFNDLERVQHLLNYIWDWKCVGKTEAELEKFAAKQGAPAPGSQRFHNENVEITAVAPDLKMTETGALSDRTRKNVLGSAGLSEFFFGILENANRAGSEGLDLPILKGLQSRQRKVRFIFKEIGNFAIDQAAIAKPTLRLQLASRKVDRSFKVNMPELSVKDMTKLGAVMAQTQVALEGAVNLGWLRKETAARMFHSIGNQFGVDYDPAEEMKLAAEELASAPDQATIDYRNRNEKTLAAAMRAAYSPINTSGNSERIS